MKILIAGDFCPCLRVADLFEQEKYSSVLGDIRPIVETADYAIVNFECTVTKGGEKPIEKQGPNLQCSEKGMEAVKWVGFDCVTLANNHFYDFGDKGVENTLVGCNKIGLDTVGGGINIEEASRVLYKEINDKKVAIINCCEHEFSIATKDTGGSNPLKPITQYYAIQEAKRKSDYVIVIVHGGQEHFQLPLPRMVETYRFFVDAGADAVINHHQHCYSGYEVYHKKPIFYGLGNFCFDDRVERNKPWNEGFMVLLEFEQENLNYSIIPYEQCNEYPRVVKVTDVYKFNKKIEELNSIIVDDEKLNNVVFEFYNGVGKVCENLFEPIQNRLYMAAKHRGLLPSLVRKKRILRVKNHVFCESHQDKLKWWLDQYLKR